MMNIMHTFLTANVWFYHLDEKVKAMVTLQMFCTTLGLLPMGGKI